MIFLRPGFLVRTDVQFTELFLVVWLWWKQRDQEFDGEPCREGKASSSPLPASARAQQWVGHAKVTVADVGDLRRRRSLRGLGKGNASYRMQQWEGANH